MHNVNFNVETRDDFLVNRGDNPNAMRRVNNVLVGFISQF